MVVKVRVLFLNWVTSRRVEYWWRYKIHTHEKSKSFKQTTWKASGEPA